MPPNHFVPPDDDPYTWVPLFAGPQRVLYRTDVLQHRSRASVEIMRDALQYLVSSVFILVMFACGITLFIATGEVPFLYALGAVGVVVFLVSFANRKKLRWLADGLIAVMAISTIGMAFYATQRLHFEPYPKAEATEFGERFVSRISSGNAEDAWAQLSPALGKKLGQDKFRKQVEAIADRSEGAKVVLDHAYGPRGIVYGGTNLLSSEERETEARKFELWFRLGSIDVTGEPSHGKFETTVGYSVTQPEEFSISSFSYDSP